MGSLGVYDDCNCGENLFHYLMYQVSSGEERVEYGSALQKGSRKGNLNHLLNFTYAPRDTGDSVSGQGRSSYGRWPRRGRYKTKYNKEQFLQAKYVWAYRITGTLCCRIVSALLICKNAFRTVFIFIYKEQQMLIQLLKLLWIRSWLQFWSLLSK